MKQFSSRTKILVGDTRQVLEGLQIQRLLVVADPFFAQNGTARSIAAARQVEIFDRVAPDPSLELAVQGAAVVQRFQPDHILALGGGSAMDCAKAMAFFSGLRPKLIAVPTTSGSGSEVTNFAILTHDGGKHPLVDEALQPDMAILDGAFLQDLPPKLIAEGGFDMLSHALEAIAATGAGPVTDALGARAFTLGLTLLPRSFAGDKGVRLELHTAATMAGMAFSSAGLGLCHALSHSLGGEFHVPHGRLNAILLPAVVEANSAAAGKQYAWLAQQAGLSAGAQNVAVRSLKNALLQLRRQLKLPQTLAQAGIAPGDLRSKMDRVVEGALADPCCGTNPQTLDKILVQRVLGEVMGHG